MQLQSVENHQYTLETGKAQALNLVELQVVLHPTLKKYHSVYEFGVIHLPSLQDTIQTICQHL
jgi:hypothetical protein